MFVNLGFSFVVGAVVILSVIAHGATATPLSSWYARRMARQTYPEERGSSAADLFEPLPSDVARITPAELAERLAAPEPPLVLDVRTRAALARDRTTIPGSLRILPDQIADWTPAESDRNRPVVTFCT